MSRLSDLVERYRLWLFTRGWKLFSLSEWVFYLPGARHCPSCLATSVYPTGTQDMTDRDGMILTFSRCRNCGYFEPGKAYPDASG